MRFSFFMDQDHSLLNHEVIEKKNRRQLQFYPDLKEDVWRIEEL